MGFSFFVWVWGDEDALDSGIDQPIPAYLMPVSSAISRFQVIMSFWLNSRRCVCPQARAMTFISSTDDDRNRQSRVADSSMFSLARSSSFCVAMPVGQLFVLQILAATQPIAWIAALATAIPSAPRQRALMKSAGVR